jgi:hypothetical protein
MTDLVGLEAAAYRRQGDPVTALREVALALASGTLVVDRRREQRAAELSRPLCTRIAAAVIATLLDPTTRLTADDFVRLAVAHAALVDAVQASGFESADHALAQLAPGLEASDPAVRRDAWLRYTVLYSLDADSSLPLEQVLDGPPDLVLLVFLGLLATKPVATVAGHRRRDQLIELAERLPATARLPLSADHIVLLSNAWMLCSYAEHPGKHAIKRRLNPILRDALYRMGLRDVALPSTRRLSERPTVVVASEIMHSNHVQYRYFGQYLRQLRARFRSVLVTDQREVDDHVRALFHEVHTFQRRTDGSHLHEAAELVRAPAPDLVYFPSVGMRHWGVALANLRHAPIQVMGLGHTATSHCETIDYCIAEAGLVSGPEVWSETMLTIPDAAHILERSPHYAPVPPEIRERPPVLRIALPSNLLKLNPRFLTLLASLRERCGRPLEFHLFPNVGGLELAAARAFVARILPGATVHPILPYNRYLVRLSQCDLNLSPFPFGGMHSVIDSIRQGLPVIAMEGRESHNRTDAMLLRRFGMPEWTIVADEEAYVAAALRLIQDDALRVALSRQAVACDVDRLLYGDASTPPRHEFADAINWLLAHHEAVQASGRRVWSLEDRLGFGDG